ncbi:MAG: flgG 2 [Anaerospora sp.]|nr:flgG 2 [Anaerospora sp.]
MIRGIYTAASGMLAESARTDTIANNLANVNTAGYKKDVAITKDFASMLIYRINDGAAAQLLPE